MSSGNCLHEAFAARAREAPGRIAVTAGDRQITYGDLDAQAERLARRLRDLGVGPERLVGLCAERGIEMIVGLLAILKAGGAYLPIDPAYPARRIEFLLGDGGVSLAVSTPEAARCLEGWGGKVVFVDGEADGPAGEGEPAAASGENLAYVIYTSGSTGTPKGVLVTHHNAMRLFEATRPAFQLGAEDVWTLFHSVSFDFSVWEIWGALLHGGRLVVVPSEVTRSPAQLDALLRKEGVTVLSQTPSAFRQLLTDGSVQGSDDLRLIVFGGEALEVRLLEPWIARHGDRRPLLVNMYGITETTVHVTAREIRQDDLARPGVSPIGAPLADLTVHLLDRSGQEVPDGEPGEICVGGPGVTRGYLNRPELTAERFAPAPGGLRLYRSGDLARRLPGGDLAYLGRIDDQIKIRGFRVEPREIEACLLGHPGVAAAVVVPQDYGDGDARLTAFVVPRPARELAAAEAEALSAALAERAAAELPLHMRPSAYRVLAEIPRTAQGKVDRAALRQGDGRPAEAAAASEPAADGRTVEKDVADIVAEVLERRIDVHDDLFDVGGTSMTLIRVLRRVNQHFDVALNGSELGMEATIARLAQCVEAVRQTNPVAIPEKDHAGIPTAP